jgi:hypothetical protein
MGRGTGGGGAVGGNRMHDIGMMEPLEDLHFALHPLLVPLDLVLRNGLQRNIAHDVGQLGGVIMRGCVGGGRGDREDGCGRGGCKQDKQVREISCSLGGRYVTSSSSSWAFLSIYSTSITWRFVGWHF